MRFPRPPQMKWMDILRKSIFWLLAPVLAVVLLLCAFPAWPQLNLGRILGAITDPSGASVAGATVTVIDVERGVSRPLTADAAGEYSAPSLTPGTYTVRAEFKGFRTTERTDIIVGVGQDVRVDLTLQPGAQTETVVVTGEAPLINTTNAQLGGTIENETINEIPLNGRQFRNLLAYKPGVMANPGTGNNKSVESNGNRPEGTVYMLDGLYDNNIFSGMPIVGGSTWVGGPGPQFDYFESRSTPFIEINVIEDPKAEHGWRPGAQVNVGLKSGMNSIHGTCISRLVAILLRMHGTIFLPSSLPKSAGRFLEQFGVSIGGPIKKDKLFYFGTYEGQRVLAGSPSIFQIPTSAAGATKTDSYPDAIADLKSHGLNPTQLSLNPEGLPWQWSLQRVVNGSVRECESGRSLDDRFQPFRRLIQRVGEFRLSPSTSTTPNGEYFITVSTHPPECRHTVLVHLLYARARNDQSRRGFGPRIQFSQ